MLYLMVKTPEAEQYIRKKIENIKFFLKGNKN